jgi:hypothetical protein
MPPKQRSRAKQETAEAEDEGLREKLLQELREAENANVEAARKRAEEERARLLAEATEAAATLVEEATETAARVIEEATEAAANVTEEANATVTEEANEAFLEAEKQSREAREERKALKKQRREVEQDRAAFEEEKADMEKAHTFQSKILLNFGGHKFTTSRQTLTSVPDTYFASLFSGRFELTPDAADDGSYFIDRDGRQFEHILNFLRDPRSFKLSPDLVTEGQRLALEVEAKFYGLFHGLLDREIQGALAGCSTPRWRRSTANKISNLFLHWLDVSPPRVHTQCCVPLKSTSTKRRFFQKDLSSCIHIAAAATYHIAAAATTTHQARGSTLISRKEKTFSPALLQELSSTTHR